MERPLDFTPVKCDGVPGYRLPYSYKLLPSGGRVVVIDPAGVTQLVSRKSLTKH